jgi:uridine kinase
VPGNDNAVAIELICTHIQRQLKDRSRHFRRKMAESLSLKSSISREPLREPSVEELGLTVLEQTPQLKVALILARVNVALMSCRAFTPSYAIEHHPDKISSFSLIV